MRTTLTLDDDLVLDIRRIMRERDQAFKTTVNDLIRSGLRTEFDDESYDAPRFASGVRPGIDLDRATDLAGQLDVDEVVRKVELRT